jgi:hypothetical protein
MADDAALAQVIDIDVGSDWIRYFRPEDGARIVLSLDAVEGAVTLTLQPDHPAIASGDKLLFEKHIIVTAAGACAAGATSLSVTALTGPLKAKAIGRRIIKDLSGYTLKFRVLAERDDTQLVLAEITASSGDDATDPNAPKADVAQVTAAKTDTINVAPGNYWWALWRTDSGVEKRLASGPFNLHAAGQQP